MRPDFGDSNGEVRAEGDIYIRRPLNEYSDLDEVFKFSFREPTVDMADRKVLVSAEYILTREAKTGRTGVRSEEYSRRVMRVDKLPAEVLERAQAMLDNMVILNEDQD